MDTGESNGLGGTTTTAAGELVPGIVFVGSPDAAGRVTALVDALVAELSALSLARVGRDVLRSLVAALGRVRAGADAAEARAVTALERLGDGGVDAVEVLRRNAGSSQREAQRRKRRAEALAEMPNVAGALAAGDISAEHAEALARAAAATSHEAVDGDADLLAEVAEVPADRAGRRIQAWTQRNQDPLDLHEQHLRQRRRRRLNFGDGDDGMLMAHAAFDRVLGAQFRSLINGIADRIWRAEGGRDNPDSRSAEQRRLDALAIAVGLEPAPAAGATESASRTRTAPTANGDSPPSAQQPSGTRRGARHHGAGASESASRTPQRPPQTVTRRRAPSSHREPAEGHATTAQERASRRAEPAQRPPQTVTRRRAPSSNREPAEGHATTAQERASRRAEPAQRPPQTVTRRPVGVIQRSRARPILRRHRRAEMMPESSRCRRASSRCRRASSRCRRAIRS